MGIKPEPPENHNDKRILFIGAEYSCFTIDSYIPDRWIHLFVNMHIQHLNRDDSAAKRFK
jgi:hypothetical protein